MSVGRAMISHNRCIISVVVNSTSPSCRPTCTQIKTSCQAMYVYSV